MTDVESFVQLHATDLAGYREFAVAYCDDGGQMCGPGTRVFDTASAALQFAYWQGQDEGHYCRPRAVVHGLTTPLVKSLLPEAFAHSNLTPVLLTVE